MKVKPSPIIYMIRHGEKPPRGPDGKDPPGLSTEGITRAEGLVETFGKHSKYNINFIIVQHPKKSMPPEEMACLMHTCFDLESKTDSESR